MSRLSYCNYCGTRLIQSRRLVGLFGRGLDRSSEPLPRSPLLAWADEEGGMSGSSLEDECEEVDPLDQPQSLSGRFHPLAPTIPKCTPFGTSLIVPTAARLGSWRCSSVLSTGHQWKDGSLGLSGRLTLFSISHELEPRSLRGTERC